jgi:hypothetical protein
VKHTSSWSFRSGLGFCLALIAGCSSTSMGEQSMSETEQEDLASVQQGLGECSAVTLVATPNNVAPLGQLITVSASAEGCSNPRFRFEQRTFFPPSIWGPWTLVEKGPSDSVEFLAFQPKKMKLRVKVKEAGAETWEASDKLPLEWKQNYSL